MKFGIFIENIGESKVAEPAYRAANAAVSLPKFTDVSLFYQNLGHCNVKRSFGIFNSTDICYFEGALVVTFLDGLKSVSNEINNRSVYYYYGLEDRKDLFGYLRYLQDKNVKVLAGEGDLEFVKKKLCRSDVIRCNTLEDVVGIIHD